MASHPGGRTLTLQDPKPGEAARLVEDAIAKGRVLIIIGNCQVEYEGRAASTLDWGERVLMIKQDGSVLLHRPSGYEPVNWQPSRCVFKTDLTKDGRLRVVARRIQPRERLSMLFDKIQLATASELKDNGTFALHVTEEQMKQAILAEPALVEDGLTPLSQEKSLGDSGFTDIFAEDRDGNLVVVEIKRNPAGRDAVLQLNRYLESIKRRVDRKVRGIIAAPSLRKGAQTLLATLTLEFRAVPPDRCFQALKMTRAARISEFFG